MEYSAETLCEHALRLQLSIRRALCSHAFSHESCGFGQTFGLVPAEELLAIQEQPARILNDILHTPEEGHSLTTIYEPVVVREGHIHDRTRQDLLANHHGPLCDGVHAQDGALWRVDDGRAEKTAIHSAIGDGKSAACHIINGNCPVPSLLAKCIDGLHQGPEIKLHSAQ